MINYILLLFFILLFFCYLFIKNKDNYKVKNSAVIVGTARDIEKFLKNTIKKLEMISQLFEKYQIIIYENDSKDNTLKILKKWKNNNKNIEIISEKNVKGLRTQRLAHGRNIILKRALKLNYDYLIVIDLDDVNQDLTKESILSSLNNKEDWAVMCANQKKYYDVYALRTYDDWMPFDCWHCMKVKRDREFCINSRNKNLPKDSLINVKSCFGGLAIYKMKYINKCVYYGGEGNTEICEHVAFNQCINKYYNGKIYINTNMINMSNN
jgi:glycosyltransferase involved in cell wall biosynthesis